MEGICRGYITYVTKVKESTNGPYFNIFFQMDEFTTKRCVCFDPNSRNLWKKLEEEAVTTQFSGVKDGDYVHDFNTPIIVGLKSPDFPIKLFNTIKEIKMDESDRKVNVSGEITLGIEGRRRLTTCRGVMDRQIFLVCDGTEEMELVAWGDAIDELEVRGKYLFNDITAKMYKGFQNLSTNPYTVITEVDDLKNGFDEEEDMEPNYDLM